jgi:hypothetical protein
MPEAQVLWHYTIVERLQHILNAGEIRPPVNLPKTEKPVVWFSANQDWEPTANKRYQSPRGQISLLSKDQTILLGGGLARIGVAPATAPLDWKTFKRESGISAARAKALYEEAVASGSRPALWFATFDPVPRAEWLAVETWDGQQWVRKAP